MLRPRMGDFTQDVPESSNAHAGAAMNEVRNAARMTPPPPPQPLPPVSIEQLLATQNELMSMLMENLMQREVRLHHHQPGGGDLLHRLSGDAPSDVRRGG
jgi:hypothetical protein